MKLRKTAVRLLAAVALAVSVAAATLGPAGHAGPPHLYASGGSFGGGDMGNGRAQPARPHH